MFENHLTLLEQRLNATRTAFEHRSNAISTAFEHRSNATRTAFEHCSNAVFLAIERNFDKVRFPKEGHMYTLFHRKKLR